MGILHQLFVALADDAGAPRDGAVEFMSRFASHQRPEDGGFYFANADDAARAAAEAENRHLPFERFYQFIVYREEIHDYPGYYLSLEVVESLLIKGKAARKALSEAQIAKDFDSENLWIDASLRMLLERSAAGVKTKPIDSQWFVVESMPELPVAIDIPRAVFVSPNVAPAGTWVVQSDGRDCLSYEGALFLQQKGLCCATRIRTSDREYAVRPRYLVSPMLLEEMLRRRVRGIADLLVPLIDVKLAIAIEGGERGK